LSLLLPDCELPSENARAMARGRTGAQARKIAVAKELVRLYTSLVQVKNPNIPRG
jgi:mitochondrial fission protein ELM1